MSELPRRANNYSLNLNQVEPKTSAVSAKWVNENILSFIEPYEVENDRLEPGAKVSGFYLSHTSIKTITPDIAKFLISNYSYEHNRTISNASVKQMKDIDYIDIDFCSLPNGDFCMINGHHRSTSIAEGDRPVRANIKIFTVKDQEARARLFRTYDCGTPRSLAQGISNGLAEGEIGIPGASGHLLGTITSGVWLARNNYIAKGKVPNTSKISILQEEDIIEFISHITPLDKKNNRLFTVGSFACFYSMWKSNPTKAIEFMQKYAEGNDLEKGSPILALREYMANRPIGGGGPQIAHDQIRRIYSAWNTLKAGKTTKILMPSNIPKSYKTW